MSPVDSFAIDARIGGRGKFADRAPSNRPALEQRDQILYNMCCLADRNSAARSLESENKPKSLSLKSAACGTPPRRAYRPCWRCGRVAEGGGLLNRYRVVKPYRGFESLRLRQNDLCPARRRR